MSDIEVIEIGVGATVELAYDPVDELAGAEVTSVSSQLPSSSFVAIDQLLDVDAPPDTVGLLERQPDRKVRPVSRTELFAEHVNAPAPHPIYDSGTSFRLRFLNGLV